MSLAHRLPILLTAPLLLLACADGDDSRNSASQGSSPTVATSVTTVSGSASASDTSDSGPEPTGGSGSAEAGETSSATAPMTGEATSDDPGSTSAVTSASTSTGPVTTVDPDTGGSTGECAEIAEKAMNKK